MKKLIKASTDLTGQSVQQTEDYCVNYIFNCFNRYLSQESQHDYNYEITNRLLSDIDEKAYGLLSRYHLTVKMNSRDEQGWLLISAEISFVTANNQFVTFMSGIVTAYPDNQERNNIRYKSSKNNTHYLSSYREYTLEEIEKQWKEEGVFCDSIEELLPYEDLSKIFAKAEYKYTQIRMKKKSDESWKSLRSELKKQIYEGQDPLYEETQAGMSLLNICTEVEDELDLFVEPSVQGGYGKIFIYNKTSGDRLPDSESEGIDFNEFNIKILKEAEKSTTENKFKSWYKSYLKALIK